MLKTPEDVLISGERHLIIHGQFGNMKVRLERLRVKLEDAEQAEVLPLLGEIETELACLEEYYPALDGEVITIPVSRGESVEVPISSEDNQHNKNIRTRNALRGMRVLMDAAHLSYQYEGSIDCHLKIMLDEAWQIAAAQVGLGNVDDFPF